MSGSLKTVVLPADRPGISCKQRPSLVLWTDSGAGTDEVTHLLKSFLTGQLGFEPEEVCSVSTRPAHGWSLARHAHATFLGRTIHFAEFTHPEAHPQHDEWWEEVLLPRARGKWLLVETPCED